MHNQQLSQVIYRSEPLHPIQSLPKHLVQESGKPIGFVLILIVLVLLSTVSSASVIQAQTAPSDSLAHQETQQRVSVVIELEDAPIAQTYSKLRALNRNGRSLDAAEIARVTQTQLARIESEQQRVVRTLASLDAQIIYQTQRVYNGIGARVYPEQLAQLRQHPSVKAIHPLIPKSPVNHTSVPYIGAPALWGGVSASDMDGDSVTIAIIDTGIDYTHSDFGGSGEVEDYLSNDPTVIGDITGFPSTKIIGGYDFAGDNYNADPDDADYQPVPNPDADPMDCYSHGTHVAGTAGGYGVNSDGSTYTGPYGSSVDLSTLKIGPGAAPRAKLYALKIFGCSGGSELTDMAIEWAVDPNGDGDLSDHVDVINMSLGSMYGSHNNSSTIASENAAKVGVIVVGSAGNSGDNYYIVGSPSISAHTISVAAIQHPEQTTQNSTIPLYDRVTTFTSRGPRRVDSFLKPDIAAPGRFIHSARQGSGNDGRDLSGTSMAAPHVAGAMALLRQHYPDWSVQALKALVMNTADHDIPYNTTTGVNYAPTRIGAGRIDIANALTTDVIAYNADDPGFVSLSFGAPAVLTTMSMTKNILVENKGNAEVTYRLSYQGIVDAPGINFTSPDSQVISETITVPAQGTVTFSIQMTAEPTQMLSKRDETVGAALSIPRHWITEEAGYLLLTPQAVSSELGAEPTAERPILTVPLYAAPRPVSDMQVVETELDFGETTYGSQQIALSGQAIQQNGTIPSPSALAITSLVSAFELHLNSPNESQTSSVESICNEILTTKEFDHADLQYVGITSDLARTTSMFNPAGLVEESTLYFAIATYQDWTSPNEVRFDIFIDVDEDGENDYRLFNADTEGYNNKFVATDAFSSILEELSTGIMSPQRPINGLHADERNTALFNTNVLFLAVKAGNLGLDANNANFDFSIKSYSNDNEYQVDDCIEKTPVMTYNIAKAGLELFDDNPNAPLNEDVNGGSIKVNFTLENYALSTAQGLLLFHHHNQTGERAEIVPIRFDLPESIYLPLIGR